MQMVTTGVMPGNLAFVPAPSHRAPPAGLRLPLFRPNVVAASSGKRAARRTDGTTLRSSLVANTFREYLSRRARRYK